LGGPYKISPPATLKVVDTPGEQRELLVQPGPGQPKAIAVVQPKSAIVERYQFSLSSPLAPGPGDRITAPDVRLKRFTQVRRFWALPKQSGGRPITWEMQGLSPGKLPDDFPTPPDASSFTVYELTEEPPRAVLEAADALHSSPRVRLADIRIVWQADAALHGAATFDVEPGKLQECPLWLPQGYRLVHIAVADVPSDPLPVGENTWRVPLGPARLPQRIEIVFSGKLSSPPSSAQCRFDVPTLGDLPVAESLWTVIGPPAVECGRPERSQELSLWQY
jgi:hypothetical protein